MLRVITTWVYCCYITCVIMLISVSIVLSVHSFVIIALAYSEEDFVLAIKVKVWSIFRSKSGLEFDT